MMKPYPPAQKSFARQLRSNQTDAEQHLWQRLRRKQLLGLQFYRQKPVGPYIVDFYCAAARLVIELDGSQHAEAEHQAHDQQRDADLAQLDLLVLRFDNLQVLKQTESVLEVIYRTLQERTANPPHPPFCKGGSEQPACLPIHDTNPSLQNASSAPPPLQKPREPSPPLQKGGQGGLDSDPTPEQAE